MSGERIPAGRVEVIHLGGSAPMLEAGPRGWGPDDPDAVLIREESGRAIGVAEPINGGVWRYLVREDDGMWPATGESVADSRDAALIQLGIALAKKYRR